MDRQNIQFVIKMLGNIDDNQAKAGTDMKAWREEMATWKEKMDAKTEAIRRETVAIRAETKARREMRNASHQEIVAENKPKIDIKTTACQETEERQEETRASRKETAALIEPETEV
jgi:hypothetical protein